jgi:hypothetical protein
MNLRANEMTETMSAEVFTPLSFVGEDENG